MRGALALVLSAATLPGCFTSSVLVTVRPDGFTLVDLDVARALFSKEIAMLPSTQRMPSGAISFMKRERDTADASATSCRIYRLFSAFGLHDISRIAISLKGDRIAIVASPK
jgi:hypothetical protein